MTLLVGIVCHGGAVIAADRQASHGVYGNVTVGHQVSKINIIGGNTIFASSGPVGLSQQFASVIQGELAQFRNRNYAGVATLLQKKIREILDPALQTAGHAARVIGQAAQSDVLCSSLLATEFKDGLQLIEIRAQGGFECLTPQLPYICQGSGRLSSRASMSWCTRPAAVVKATEKPFWQAASPRLSPMCVLPVPELPSAMMLSRRRIYSQRESSRTSILLRLGIATKSNVSRLFTAGKRAWRMRRSTTRRSRSMSSSSTKRNR